MLMGPDLLAQWAYSVVTFAAGVGLVVAADMARIWWRGGR
jgi:hypothetical protein